MINQENKNFLAHISWGAIIAGAILALSVQFMLTLLGTGVGLVSLNPADGVNMSAYSWGAGIWFAISFFVALFFGGFVASRLSSNIKRYAGVLNSLVVWSLVVVLNIYVAGSGVSKVGGAVTNSLGYMTKSLDINLPSYKKITGIDFENVQQEIDELLEESDNEELKSLVKNEYREIKKEAREAARDIAMNPGSISNIFREFGNNIQDSLQTINSAIDREDLSEMISAKSDLSEQEAQVAVQRWKNRINDWTQNFQEKLEDAKDQALKQAEEVTDKSGSIALWAFFTLLLGVFAAAWGGRMGTSRSRKEYRA